ncbi:hypothetical protein POVCU2_0051470 [Plasmodium ovale curtisi]|uniref:Uroporphyrinogen-III synthase n=2 Tax=Plasmodium ovale TaxID=36330 RepID=A0A1A8WB43_PLAOA|nr:hypothetical protein POVCU2_0051470 [Plasmodium ovale curtisi]
MEPTPKYNLPNSLLRVIQNGENNKMGNAPAWGSDIQTGNYKRFIGIEKKLHHLEPEKRGESGCEEEERRDNNGTGRKETYEHFFTSKMYLPGLKANKDELHFFFKIVRSKLERSNNDNVYISLMNLLCRNFPSYIGLFAHLWFQCKVLLAEKLILIEFFRQLKINSEIINHFFNYGYDSFETLLCITPHDLIKVQNFNNVTWVPGHIFRIKMIFSKIHDYVKSFIEKNEDYIKKMKIFILEKRKKTELTSYLSPITQKYSKKKKKNYTSLNSIELDNFNTIMNQPNTSLNIKHKNRIYNDDSLIDTNNTFITNNHCFPYPLLRIFSLIFQYIAASLTLRMQGSLLGNVLLLSLLTVPVTCNKNFHFLFCANLKQGITKGSKNIKNYEQVRKEYHKNSNLLCVKKDYLCTDPAREREKSKLYILITSPEGARIYRFLVTLLILNLDTQNKIDVAGAANLAGVANATGAANIADADNVFGAEKWERDHGYYGRRAKRNIMDIPIISIGKSCSRILNSNFRDNDLLNLQEQHNRQEKQFPECSIDMLKEINSIYIGMMNIVFTPTSANAETLKRELLENFFEKQYERWDDIPKIVWISSSISNTNFYDMYINYSNGKKNKVRTKHHIEVVRVDCYNTKKVLYKGEKKIKKNSIVCLMSNSAVMSFYTNFGNNFDYVVCMGRNCYMLLKKLHFKNVFFPHDSKMESFLNILMNLHHELKEKYKKKFNVILTREKYKNDMIEKILLGKNIPYQIVPCIQTEYNFQGIRHLYKMLLAHARESP